MLHTAARVAARASRISSIATSLSPAHSALSIAHVARRASLTEASVHAHSSSSSAAVHKPVGSWPVLNTAKRFEARIANCGIGSSCSNASSSTHASVPCASVVARKKPQPAAAPAAQPAAAAAACRSPAVTDGGWPALHTAARCCAHGSSSCTMGGSAAPGAFGRMCDACRQRAQQQELAEEQLQQRCEQRQSKVAAGLAVAQSEPGSGGMKAESGSGANRWHYW
jgi:hypothetical protein